MSPEAVFFPRATKGELLTAAKGSCRGLPTVKPMRSMSVVGTLLALDGQPSRITVNDSRQGQTSIIDVNDRRQEKPSSISVKNLYALQPVHKISADGKQA